MFKIKYPVILTKIDYYLEMVIELFNFDNK
ncbi:hypothetical protein SAMN04489796_101266 [Winogradskyella thalassocola]|uniref:Uncharacterized protein n=1 Tax=Winogradskyella thalassocola TaxID=262004 RepID=A0A1G7W6C7_9FLAO|nr:hypothetical protein SAMN04489796_101266 [Winogradskyella thalassocola]